MAFDPVLMIMQPRQIDEAINSLKENIDIPKVWFKAYTERQVVVRMNQYIKETNFSHYIVMSDDGVVSKKAADTILKYGEMTEYDVFTGWMNMCLEERSGRTHKEGTLITNWDEWALGKESTVCLDSLPPLRHWFKPEAYEYPPRETVTSMFKRPKELIQTSIACFAFTCASREIFLEHPLKTYPNGKASDHEFSVPS